MIQKKKNKLAKLNFNFLKVVEEDKHKHLNPILLINKVKVKRNYKNLQISTKKKELIYNLTMTKLGMSMIVTM